MKSTRNDQTILKSRFWTPSQIADRWLVPERLSHAQGLPPRLIRKSSKIFGNAGG
jgi:hypothetical protein